MERSKTLGLNGVDRVQYMIEANGGHTKGTVDAVASSGEKSRLLLLLETLLPGASPRDSPDRVVDGQEDDSGAVTKGGVEGVDSAGRGVISRTPPCTVLYDEIDAHVGGRTAVAVGRLLANQGRESQVRYPSSWRFEEENVCHWFFSLTFVYRSEHTSVEFFCCCCEGKEGQLAWLTSKGAL